MIDRRMVTNFDWLLLGLILLLAAASALSLYYAASSYPQSGTPIFLKQIYWFGIGLAAGHGWTLYRC